MKGCGEDEWDTRLDENLKERMNGMPNWMIGAPPPPSSLLKTENQKN